MTQQRKLAQLTRIARMKKELELADLARLARSRDAVEALRADLTSAEQAARRAALASAEAARTAEGFSSWVQYRQSEAEIELQKLTGEFSRQKERAAGAVGRHDVLGKLEMQLGEDARYRKSGRS